MAREFHGRVVIGIMLVLIGLLFFLENHEPFNELIPSFIYKWEFFFILFGLLFFLLSRNKIAGIIFFSIGLFNLVPELWPLVFIFIGIYILIGFKGLKNFSFSGPNDNVEKDKNYLEQISIFGGGSKVFLSDNFKGGNIISIFGGSEVNLTGSKLAEGENILETTSIFGGSTIVIPNDWNVITDVLPIFGGFSDKRKRDPNQIIDTNKTLIIKGVAIFGGGEVKSTI
ncbi:MAG: cell wall-active antibiotics response protein [Melioribacteraceae bacterium]|nr:cell wall-active antibiotics response protein [Melioribacteraceae bacterium]